MSYCWRLQYYCKLGAANRAGPIYYVSQLPQQAYQFRNQLRVVALPRVITLCQRQKKQEPPVQAGEGPWKGAQSLLCQVVSGWWADSCGKRAGGGRVTSCCDTCSKPIAVVMEQR
uniref:Uncharacterized protein n=1 Tax=Nomascus leucogenys TaxID=61853 RepID=A0A2I3GK62_NOMLE